MLNNYPALFDGYCEKYEPGFEVPLEWYKVDYDQLHKQLRRYRRPLTYKPISPLDVKIVSTLKTLPSINSSTLHFFHFCCDELSNQFFFVPSHFFFPFMIEQAEGAYLTCGKRGVEAPILNATAQFDHCKYVMVTSIFGGRDVLPPIPENATNTICYIAFLDQASIFLNEYGTDGTIAGTLLPFSP